MALPVVSAFSSPVDMPRTYACGHNLKRHALRHLRAPARLRHTFRLRTCSGESTVGKALGKVAGQSRLK